MAPPSATELLPETDTTSVMLPPRLTTQNVAKRRAASGKLVAGIAAVADVETYKGRIHHLHKPKAKRFDHRLTHEAKIRKGNSLKNAAGYLKTPGLISLGGGLPSSEYFPFDKLSFKVPGVRSSSEPSGEIPGSVVTAGKHDQAEDKSVFDISTAFNYGQGHGAAQLIRWCVEHTEIVHDPPYQDWSCTMTAGSTSATDMAFRMFCKPGDWLLTEQYTYPTMVEAARPLGVRIAAVSMDEYGLCAKSLDEMLSNWDVTVRRGRKPFILYTVPTGQNPTGSTQTLQRRKDIYAVAQKHDLYILEDEPYYFLQMQSYTGPNAPDVPPPASHEEFLKSLVPSYISMDVDGRVMRMDSFSKVIAPGARCGWITASEQICERYRTHADVSTQGPSGISQLMLFKLLDEHWGHGGYLDWLVHIRMEYTTRRNTMLEACERHLPAEIISYVPPMAGMFHWLEVDYKKHPDYPQKSMHDIEDEIFLKIIDSGTLLMKGSWFMADEEAEQNKMFLRATYAAAPFDQIQEAIKRLGIALRESFGLAAQTNGTH